VSRPQPSVPVRELEPLLGTSHFRVQIGRREIGFCEVGRLTSETDLTIPPEHWRHRLETVLLRRALTRSRELFEWRKRIVEGIEDRRQVTISQLDAPTGEVANSWRLVRAWPCRWSGPAFNAAESGLAYEELELAFDDLVWLEEPAPPVRPSRPAKRTQGA
jgi:T4-like virus tail tube protein gp19